MLTFILTVLAIDNLADILTNVDLLEWLRLWIEKNFPKAGKIARCKYCQMFWLALACALFAPPAWLIYCLALHRVAQFSSELYDRYINRAPMHLYIQQATTQNPAQESESLQK